MVARGLAAATVVLFAAGCGSTFYTAAQAQDAAGGHPSAVITYGEHDFATWAAVTALELDPDPLYEVYAGEVNVFRFASAHGAQAKARSGLGWTSFTPGAGPPLLVRRGNLLIVGSGPAVRAALRRLP